jgi:HEPN domain-containing protein
VPVAQRKLNRATLQSLARIRLADAQALFAAGRFGATYYLAGYVVECALKACIAKGTAQYDFPDRKLAEQSWTHSLGDLVAVAGLRADLDAARRADPNFEDHWATVVQWSEHFRYHEGITQQDVREILEALTDPLYGVLRWVQPYW